MVQMHHLGEWDAALKIFQKKHGKPAAGVAVTLEENVRRDSIKEMRSAITEPEHRFFLALLMNVPDRADFFKLVAQRFPGEKPLETVLRWAEELSGETEDGFAILDASIPEMKDFEIKKQPGLFFATLRYFMNGGKKMPAGMRVLSASQVKELRAAFAASSLRVLVA